MSNLINILMIDDDEEDFIITRDFIREIPNRKYKMEWRSNYADGLKTILQNTNDVIFVDYKLGAENGLNLIKEAISKGCEAPIILLTGQNDIEIDEEAMKAGAIGLSCERFNFCEATGNNHSLQH